VEKDEADEIPTVQLACFKFPALPGLSYINAYRTHLQ
jgi:hypothetical protein